MGCLEISALFGPTISNQPFKRDIETSQCIYFAWVAEDDWLNSYSQVRSSILAKCLCGCQNDGFYLCTEERYSR